MTQGLIVSMRTAGVAAAETGRGFSSGESFTPIRYPDPDILVLDPRFQPMVLGHAAIERVATGFRFTEGPAY